MDHGSPLNVQNIDVCFSVLWIGSHSSGRMQYHGSFLRTLEVTSLISWFGGGGKVGRWGEGRGWAGAIVQAAGCGHLGQGWRIFLRAVPKFFIHFEEILSPAHGNF